jgi:hypothetical protein
VIGMTDMTVPPRSAAISGRLLTVLSALAVALGAAFVFAPHFLAATTPGGGFADQRAIVAALRPAFIDYWNSGHRAYSPGLERLADYWFRYHVAKAAMAALLLIVLVVLGLRLWKACMGAVGPGMGRTRVALASAGALVTALALFSVAMVMANIQGAVAPVSSLLSMLPFHTSDRQLTDAFGQIRQGLAAYPSAGDRTPPPLQMMVSDFARYHATLAVLATIVALVLAGMSVVAWRRFAQTGSSERRMRYAHGSLGVLWALVSLGVIVVDVANIGTAMDPAPALLAFFNGSW